MIGKSNIGGGKSSSNSGSYVWKKYEWIPETTITNPTFDLIEPSGSSSLKTLMIRNPSFNLLRVGNFGEFMNGFEGVLSTNSNARRCFRINSYSNKFQYGLWTYSSGYSYYYYDIDSYTVISESMANVVWNSSSTSFEQYTFPFTFNGTKTLTGIKGELTSFVVSDDSSAYPNGAVHTDGYYYELLASV